MFITDYQLATSGTTDPLALSKKIMKFRKATKADVSKIVQMIVDDELGKTRENFQNPLPLEYMNAFQNIDEDYNQELMVVENEIQKS